jgi:signal transduction histidine kinase
MTLRQRFLLILAPLLLLAAVLGGAGVFLLHQVGVKIDVILRENYDSVVFMIGMDDALQRIDASFSLALLGEKGTDRDYHAAWKEYDRNLKGEESNITLPGEGELVDRLRELTKEYRKAGDGFHARTDGRQQAYFGTKDKPGLRAQYGAIHKVIADIRELNQRYIVQDAQTASHTAKGARLWLGVGLGAAAVLAALLARWMLSALLQPVRDMTQSALAIGSGNLNQQVPVPAQDELGQLAQAFNRMTGQLREYRQAHSSRLLRAQRTSQASIDAFPDPVLVLDPEGHVEMANPAARQVLGIAPPSPWYAQPDRVGVQAPPGEKWTPPPALALPLDDALKQLRPYLPQNFDQTISFRLGGEERSYLPQILPIQDPYGNTLGAAVVFNDVTRFRLLDQIKTDLVSTVSHELKTPLTSVRLALHLLLEETVGPLTPKQTELLLDARDNAERLLKMIEHLLALARLEQGREAVSIQPMAPADLLRAAADAAAPRAEAKHIELKVENDADLPPVGADPARLGAALNNLLDNALTYTGEGGRITLSARAAGTDAIEVAVRDSGIGIPRAYLPHVFEKFFRVPQNDGHGTGLGLAIVREIVVAHGGHVRCESEEGKGSVFTLTLPIWKGDGTASAALIV